MIRQIAGKLFEDDTTGKTIDFAAGNHVEIKAPDGQVYKYGFETAIGENGEVGYLIYVPQGSDEDSRLLQRVASEFHFYIHIENR